MSGYVWGFIAVFMIHEMEEVFGLPNWIKAHIPELCEKYPFIANAYMNCSSRRFTAAVYEELLLYTAVCLFSELTGNNGAWFAMLAEFTFHLVVHLVFAVIVRGYIPSVATSALMLPPCAFLIVRTLPLIDLADRDTLAALIIFALLNPLNFVLLHRLFDRSSVHEKN